VTLLLKTSVKRSCGVTKISPIIDNLPIFSKEKANHFVRMGPLQHILEKKTLYFLTSQGFLTSSEFSLF